MNTTFLSQRPAAAQRRFTAAQAAAAGSTHAGSRILVLHQADHRRELADLRGGLFDAPAHIDPKYFYDPRGCALFNAICKLPEYYLTRTETAIFERYQMQMLEHLPHLGQWIDLGCGSGEKSETWIRATSAKRYIGVDIASAWLDQTVRGVAGRFPGVECLGVVADFSVALTLQETLLERPDLPSIFFYPGSSLGNFSRDGALRFLRCLRGHLDARGCLLVGIDLVKDTRVLEAAYNDAQGVTAAFNRNVLGVVNRLLDADFDARRFAHHAFFNDAQGRIEMHLRSSVAQQVRIGTDWRTFDAGECILTEHSHKYTLASFSALLSSAGFSRRRAWTDPSGGFAVFLVRA